MEASRLADFPKKNLEPPKPGPGASDGLALSDLWVAVDGKEVVKGVSLRVQAGEIHALMGPNGSGKSTLALAVMGHPRYVVTRGSLALLGTDLAPLRTDERARLGLFLGVQYPEEIPGVPVAGFLRRALLATKAEELPVLEFHRCLRCEMERLGMAPELAQRALNQGFSGGEKKRNEILQAVVLRPKIAILDEPDSGLDVDGVLLVSAAVSALAAQGTGVLVITHYPGAVRHLRPQVVHVMVGGRVVESGDGALARRLEREGYEAWRHEANDNGR